MDAPVGVRRVGLALGLSIFCQAGLGIWTLVSATPLSLGLAHQAAAAGVLGLATAFLWTSRRA
jgi:cytochrome c oxidase assembly protein subunit 15